MDCSWNISYSLYVIHIEEKNGLRCKNVTQTANTMKQTDEVERALDYCLVGLVSESFGT